MRSPKVAHCATPGRPPGASQAVSPRRGAGLRALTTPWRRGPAITAGLGIAACLLACSPEKPPSADDDKPPVAAGVADAAGAKTIFDPTASPFVLTYAAERGAFADTDDMSEVPERAHGLVKVHMLDGPRPPAGKVWVANLREKDDAGHHALRTVPIELFEELALGEGLSSEVELPEGLDVPEAPPKADKVIVYKTEWCGVCKKLTAYLDRKGVEYEAKDIEKDPAAAAELQAKAQAKGVKTGSVPVIDVEGELMVGFDRGRLENMLAG